MKAYYTSNELIKAVQRNINIPLYQLTYTNEDILAFATEELFLAQVPSIMQFHEEYFVFQEEVALVANKSKYQIPKRAIGMKLRDLFYKDANGNLIEMSKVNPDDKAYFQEYSNASPEPIHYYVQNNSIIIVPEVSANVRGSLVFTYYLRPNSLVPDENAVICSSFSKKIDIVNASLIAGDELSFDGITLIAGTDYVIGANSTTTASNIASAINNLNNPDLSATTVGPAVIVTYQNNETSFSTTNASAIVISNRVTINSTQPVAEGMVDGSLVDFIQADGGHSTLAIDVRLIQGAVSTSSVDVLDSQLPGDFVVGDHVCLAGQAIIPQVPTDLHMLLVERVCARILSAQGDTEGLQGSNSKIRDYEQRQATVIDSRVDGSPTKVFNRNSILRYGKTRRGL